jgi:hypothetical protein
MRVALFLFCFGFVSLAESAWTPPADPDPHAILNEAQADRAAQRYEDALAKHLWVHRESTKHRPAFVGVRGSYAIGDWWRLATRYPPAMDALLKARADAAHDVITQRDVRDGFGDVAAIDRELNDWSETYRLFLLIESRDEAQARKLQSTAQEALIEMKDFVRAAKYLDVGQVLRRILDMKKDFARMSERSPGMAAQVASRFVLHKVEMTTAVLVLGGRAEEARAFAAKVRLEFPDAEASAAIARGLEGRLPEPFLPKGTKEMLNRTMP